MSNSRNNPTSLLISLCTPTKFFQMVELLLETVGKSSEIASVIPSLITEPRAVIFGLKFFKSKDSEGYCELSFEVIFYLTHPVTLCEVLKSLGSAVSKKDIPEGKCGSFMVFHTQEYDKMMASLLFVCVSVELVQSVRGD